MSIDINHNSGKISTENKDLKLDAVGADTNISAESNRIVNVQNPLNPQDAVTKQYLDDAIGAITGGSNVDITQLTSILNKLTPQSPEDISQKTLSISSALPYRITDFTQTDNTSTGLSASAGDTVPRVLRNNDFQTNTLTQIGPGDTGTLEVVRNGITTASVDFTSDVNNGTYTDTDNAIISSNVDYGTITGDPLGFWQVYNASASGTNTVPEGWNNIKLVQGSAETNTVTWYSDQSNPGAPSATNIVIEPHLTQTGVTYSSSIPHYTNQQKFKISFDVANLSGDFYPATDTFITNSGFPVNSGIINPPNKTYSDFGMPTPLPRNYLTGGTTLNIEFLTSVNTGTGISLPNKGPTIRIDNSYQTTTVFLGVQDRILYMIEDDTNDLDETNIIVDNVGFGTGNARRVVTADTDTPSEITTLSLWDSQTTTLNTYDATIAGGVLTHDTTNYSTGYLPVGPDLSTGRTGAQYINFAFNRTATSKFKIKWTGKVSGCFVKLPGSSVDNTSSINGWIDPSIPYEGTGVPGANTAEGGNGTNGCGLASVITLNSQVTNEEVNVTFGIESSSNATDNAIVVRFKLEQGDSITALRFERAD